MNVDDKTILIIDDDSAVRQSLADYLVDLDYRVVTAENGRIGLEVFEREKVDLVLVDLRMPEVDGLEVLSRISRINSEMPLIVVSGTGVIADAVEALHQGAWDYVLKPIEDFSVLRHAIDSAFDKARLRRENLHYQRHLEQMVVARTRELEKANKNLTNINNRLRGIVDSTRELSRRSDLETFAQRLLEEFGRHMSAAGGSVFFKEDNGLRLAHSLDPGHAPELIPFPLPGSSVFHRLMEDNQPILIEDISVAEGFSASGWNSYQDGSLLAFPLFNESGEIAAALSLHNKKHPPFLEQDKETGAILASYGCEALRAVRAGAELRESELQLRSILDNIRAGIIIMKEGTKEVLYVNPTATEMMESTAGDIIGSNGHEILFPVDDGQCSEIDLDWQVESSEMILKTVRGAQLPILISITKTNYKGEQSLLASFIDQSAQKQSALEKAALESQLRQGQKMEALGTLAGGIAHDFNNILGAVIGYTELCFLGLDHRDKTLRHKLNLILNASIRAKELVDQILTFSRMQEHNLVPVCIAPIVQEALKLLQASLPANVQLKENIISQEHVMADSIQIHQVIMNLCTNAYHAMEENGGTLTVSLESVQQNEQNILHAELPTGDFLQLAVQDTGSGICPTVLEHIYDPYFSTKDKSKGTGLGLAVVHGIVKHHGGAISVNSQIGQGTVFRVFLPITEERKVVEEERPTLMPQGTEKILLVDDEEDLVDIGCEMLEWLGYDVTGVVGSLEALETFKQCPERFDLVITDLSMPVMSGDRLAQEIVSLRPDVPVILCTGFSESLDEKRARALGIRKLLMKPMAMKVLAEIVRGILDES